MKKTIILSAFLLALTMISCKNSEGKSETGDGTTPKLLDSEGYTTYVGEYFYSEDGAVLKGSTFIYAVTMDDLAKELGDQISPIKQEEYDMIPVVVKGIVSRNPALDEGKQVWEQIITLKEIVSIGDTPAEADIKIEEKKS